MVTPFDYATNYLSRYPKSAHELRGQLKKKWYAPEEIDEAVDLLIKRGFLDDSAYAKLYLSSEVSRKGKSLTLIIGKLRQKGVDKDVINELVEKMNEELTEGTTNKVQKEIEKLQNRGLEEKDIVQKLRAKGYKYDQIRDCLHPKDE